jgi:hypothetical protein
MTTDFDPRQARLHLACVAAPSCRPGLLPMFLVPRGGADFLGTARRAVLLPTLAHENSATAGRGAESEEPTKFLEQFGDQSANVPIKLHREVTTHLDRPVHGRYTIERSAFPQILA